MKKIAIIRRNGLGDLLCAVPLMNYLKEKGEYEITLFVEQRNAPLLPYLNCFHNSVILPSKGNKYWNHFKTAVRFNGKFDIALSAKTSPMKLMNFFLFMLGAKERIAYVDQSWHSCLINSPKIYEPNDKHQALKTLNLIDPHLTRIEEKYFPRISPSVSPSRPLTVLVSASTTLFRNRFDEARYAALLNRLYEEAHFQALVISEPKDAIRAERISKELVMKHEIHFPRHFDEFMLLLNQGDLFFVGDGGIGHLGAALGKREVILFGSSDPKIWAPLNPLAEYFYHPEHVNHLNDEEVFEALKRKIACKR